MPYLIRNNITQAVKQQGEDHIIEIAIEKNLLVMSNQRHTQTDERLVKVLRPNFNNFTNNCETYGNERFNAGSRISTSYDCQRGAITFGNEMRIKDETINRQNISLKKLRQDRLYLWSQLDMLQTTLKEYQKQFEDQKKSLLPRIKTYHDDLQRVIANQRAVIIQTEKKLTALKQSNKEKDILIQRLENDVIMSNKTQRKYRRGSAFPLGRP